MTSAPSLARPKFWRGQLYWAARWKLERYRRALAYARDRFDADTASRIIMECEDAAGCWPIETLDLAGAMEWALEKYEPHPELEDLAREACGRVAEKWSSTGDAAAPPRIGRSTWSRNMPSATESSFTRSRNNGQNRVVRQV